MNVRKPRKENVKIFITRRKLEVFNYGFDYVSTTFEVENITSNCKMFFSTQNDVFNYLPK